MAKKQGQARQIETDADIGRNVLAPSGAACFLHLSGFLPCITLQSCGTRRARLTGAVGSFLLMRLEIFGIVKLPERKEILIFTDVKLLFGGFRNEKM